MLVVTDLGQLRPDAVTCELTLTHVHPGVDPDQVRAATSWPLVVAENLAVTPNPTPAELTVLRGLVKQVGRET